MFLTAGGEPPGQATAQVAWEVVFLKEPGVYRKAFDKLCHMELHLEEAGRLQRKSLILYMFIISAIFYFSEHGKQT